MSLLVESVKILNGRLYNLSEHQARFDKSRKMCFGRTDIISLREIIEQKGIPSSGLYKCRILYGAEIDSVYFQTYQFPDITTLKIVQDDDIRYDFKWLERPGLEKLFKERETAQEIIIIKNGLVTDAFYYNLVFERNGVFLTPAVPLLLGTKRAKLMKKGQISPAVIHEEDIITFEKIHLINALTDLNRVTVGIHAVI
jgi:4-amino-4-deoxychorismate lyase